MISSESVETRFYNSYSFNVFIDCDYKTSIRLWFHDFIYHLLRNKDVQNVYLQVLHIFHTYNQNGIFLQVFKTKEVLKRSITDAFPCVVLFASNLVLRHFESLNILIFLWGALFFVTFFQILAQYCDQKFARDFTHLVVKFNILNFFKKQLQRCFGI